MNTKKISILVLCLLAVATSIAPAFAEDVSQVKVTIPFAFRAGTVNLPAGEYTIIEENSEGLFLIESRSASAMFVTAPGKAQPINIEARPELTFQRTGQASVLTEIRMADETSHLLPLRNNAR